MTAAVLQETLGAGLAGSGWVVPRIICRSRGGRLPALLLDASPAGFAAALLLAATARPVFAGVVVFSIGIGFAFADYVKREVLHEPVVFSDISELQYLFTHPQLYLPFAGPWIVIGGALAAIGSAAVLVSIEPPLWPPDPLAALLAAVLSSAALWLLSRSPGLGVVARGLHRFAATGKPFEDTARLGPFATLLIYGIIARADRTRRRMAHLPTPAVVDCAAVPPVPVLLVQCESFFDARRLPIGLPGDYLPGLDACRAGAAFGRLEVDAWGANTTRAEFAVLTGLGADELGYDRFNPYHAFGRSPVNSLAWELRQAGYRTICLHPFDRRFFGRDRVLPALGFEDFFARETIGGSLAPPYFPDPLLAEQILAVLDNAAEMSFIFAITMGNHGPWLDERWSPDPRAEALLDALDLPQRAELCHYLAGLRQSDEMLRRLITGLDQRRFPGIFAFYGDHLPSLPCAFAGLGFEESATDYVLWRRGAVPRRLDLAARGLKKLISATLADTRTQEIMA